MAEKKIKSTEIESSNGQVHASGRVSVDKTYKLYIGGAFPRTESGRYTPITLKDSSVVNICEGSRKDFRESVVAARKAQSAWSARTAYNKGQILYRIAEMLEARRAQFVELLLQIGSTDATEEVDATIDRIVHYAGWSDKYQQVFSTVNPVSGPYFNFSVPEPTGVVAIICPNHNPLLALVTNLLASIVSGNTCILIVPPYNGSVAITLAEVLHTSDLPGGVVNIITGSETELAPHISGHMDVNAVIYASDHGDTLRLIQLESRANVKRTISRQYLDWSDPKLEGPYLILDTVEIKTTWHPIGQ